MKKKVLVLLALFGMFGLGTSITYKATQCSNYVVVKAEDTTEEIEEDNEEESEEESDQEDVEDIDLLGGLSQTAYDVIEVIKEFCSQPLTIAGVSTTVGAIIISILVKVFSSVGNKKSNKELLENIVELTSQIAKYKNDKDKQAQTIEELKKAIVELAKTNKNVKVKDNVLALLEESKPVANEVVEDTKEFAKEETEKVTSKVLDILEN